jgi:CRISPR-associated protein Csd1
MILQALNDYYLRKAADPQTSLAPEGFELKAIPFVLVLDAQGRLLHLADRREGSGKKKEARGELVPQGVKKTSGVAANLLWDSAEYVLGVDTRGKPERVAEQHAAFVQRFAESFGVQPEDSLACVPSQLFWPMHCRLLAKLWHCIRPGRKSWKRIHC